MKALLTICILALTLDASAQTVDEIIAKHEKAMGGADNWSKVKTLKMKGTVVVPGHEFNFAETLDPGKVMRMDISGSGADFANIVTPTKGWVLVGTTRVDTMRPAQVLSGQILLNYKHNQVLDYKSSGSKGQYLGKEKLGPATCYKIKFKHKNGSESTSFFDVTNYYLLRTDYAIKVDGQKSDVSVVYNNYKKMDGGLVMPMFVSGDGSDMTYKSIEINKPIDRKVFVPTIKKN